jgi:murein DD-endopeptidase MepM/ murein hydrolase activator NlpD
MAFPRSSILLMLCVAAAASAADTQPELRAPWKGSATITQGNESTCSHNVGPKRTSCGMDKSTTWENTYGVDISKAGAPFDVLAPADGVVTGFVDAPPYTGGGRQLWIQVGGSGPQVVLMHLSEIKPAFKGINAIVKQGDVVGVSGNTTSPGVTFGVHLHMHIWAGFNQRDSHTAPIQRLRLIPAGQTTPVLYQSKQHTSQDDPSRASLEDAVVANKTFLSDNATVTPVSPPATNRIANGSFETIKVSTNTSPDGSWTRVAFSGESFNTLAGGGTWGHNGSSAYMLLGYRNSASQTVESAPFVVESTATDAQLLFSLSIDSAESTSTNAYDVLRASLVDATTRMELTSPGYISNLSKTGSPTSYVQRTWPIAITAIRGHKVVLRFVATTDMSYITTFRVDDVSVLIR